MENIYLCKVNINIVKNKTNKRKEKVMSLTKTKKRKLTPEENKAINSAKPTRNKSMSAFRAHQGEVWVKDPMLLL